MEAEFCSSHSCWATLDPITCSSIIWRVGMLLITKRAWLVGLSKPVTAITKPNFSLLHPSIAPNVTLPWFCKGRIFIKYCTHTKKKKIRLWFLEGPWKLCEFLWVSPTWMLQYKNSYPVFSHRPWSRAAPIPDITNIKSEGYHQSCCLLPVGHSLILLIGNYLGKWKKDTCSYIVENRLYLVSEPQQTGLSYTRKENEMSMALASLPPCKTAPRDWVLGILQ